MSKVWLVTGGVSGLGRDIVLAALKAGDCVVVAARQMKTDDPEFQEFAKRIGFAELDVKDEAAAEQAIQLAKERFGRLDVLVNNAGYGKFAAFEQMTSEDFQAVMDVNFMGTVYSTRAAVPIMREQGSGILFQISSIGGRLAMPGNSPYIAAKHAVGGFSDALRLEVEPLGIQVCVIEPGGIRTDWSRRASNDAQTDVLSAYEKTVGAMLKRLKESDGKQENDPKLIADLLVKLSQQKQLPHRLVLGSAALKSVIDADSQRREELEEYSEMSQGTIFS